MLDAATVSNIILNVLSIVNLCVCLLQRLANCWWRTSDQSLI